MYEYQAMQAQVWGKIWLDYMPLYYIILYIVYPYQPTLLSFNLFFPLLYLQVAQVQAQTQQAQAQMETQGATEAQLRAQISSLETDLTLQNEKVGVQKSSVVAVQGENRRYLKIHLGKGHLAGLYVIIL
jgi:hypothetical protein